MTNPVQSPTAAAAKAAAQDAVRDVAGAAAQNGLADVSSAKSPEASRKVGAEDRALQAADATPADLRLIIEESDAGHYVYTVVDRRTGDVVSQLPREEVVHLKDQPGYKAGDLFKGLA